MRASSLPALPFSPCLLALLPKPRDLLLVSLQNTHHLLQHTINQREESYESYAVSIDDTTTVKQLHVLAKFRRHLCYLVNGTQKHLVMTAIHNFDCVPGARVGLSSQVGAAAGWSASFLQASSQSCQQVGGQLTCLPPTPPACSHKPRSAGLLMPDRSHLGTALAEARSEDLWQKEDSPRHYCLQYLSCQELPEMVGQRYDSA